MNNSAINKANKESLSALIDGEASEIEVHRLVREFDSDSSLATSWSIYQEVRSTLHRDGLARGSAGMGIEKHRLLFTRISEAVAAEENLQVLPDSRLKSRPVVGGSLAVAACLVIAVFVGIQQADQDSVQRVAETVDEPVEVMTVANEGQTAELVELDEEKQRQLRAYLNQHDRMSRMNNDHQLVNYRDRGGN